jgi:hypothetical protein
VSLSATIFVSCATATFKAVTENMSSAAEITVRPGLIMQPAGTSGTDLFYVLADTRRSQSPEVPVDPPLQGYTMESMRPRHALKVLLQPFVEKLPAKIYGDCTPLGNASRPVYYHTGGLRTVIIAAIQERAKPCQPKRACKLITE